MAFTRRNGLAEQSQTFHDDSSGPVSSGRTISPRGRGVDSDHLGSGVSIRRRSFFGLVGGVASISLLNACAAGSDAKNNPEVTLDALSKEYEAKIGLSVYDHSRNKSFNYHGDVKSYEASVVKVPIALTVMRVANDHGGKLDQEQRDLVQRSVGQSDNDATAALFASLAQGQEPGSDEADTASSGAINETYEKLGVQRTRTNKTWGDNETYAEDQVQIAKGLVNRVDWVDSDDLEFLTSLMTPVDESQGWGVGSMQSAKAGDKHVNDVDVKNGWLPNDDGTWNITSMGVVFAEDATYSVAVVSTGFESFEEGQKVANEAVKAYFNAL
ncbi:hypothetical protein [Kocuria sp. TGY1127_2]|uniref:hypothetical protein n=1 Tax=Kocuria sp. TGY1127_2 TaxID=2711328 RepID=UPI0015BF11C1|nr:hypothetical protein [Kocuria sp. TGY1127_2]